MANILTKKDSKVDQNVDVSCRKCRRSTKHSVLSDIQLNGNIDNDYSWVDEYQIVQCRGCETMSFRKTHENSEDFYQTGPDDLENTLYVDIYPNPEENRKTVEDDRLLPGDLQRIYTETIKAINSSLPVLTGIGIRAIVETVCKDKDADGTRLNEKIDDLVEQGVLTKDDADILHRLRTLGNEAAHEVKPHDNLQLGLALDVIDHLLQGVYILPHHVKTRFK